MIDISYRDIDLCRDADIKVEYSVEDQDITCRIWFTDIPDVYTYKTVLFGNMKCSLMRVIDNVVYYSHEWNAEGMHRFEEESGASDILRGIKATLRELEHELIG